MMNPPNPEKITAVILHRYPMVRLGIRALADATGQFRVLADMADPDEAYALVQSQKPNIMVLDMHLPGCTGFDVLRELRQRWQKLRVLVYCDLPTSDYPERCLRAGAHGCVALDEPADHWLEAIVRISRGHLYLNERHTTQLLSRLTQSDQPARLPVERLSESELGVLTFIARGMSSRDIAKALHRSVKTIETHRTRIKRKVGVANSTALAQFAIKHFDQKRAAARPAALPEDNTEP